MADVGVLQLLESLGSGKAALSSVAQGALDQAGLVLTGAQVEALACVERDALAAQERVSFGPGALDSIVAAFAGSPYVQQDSIEPLMHELLGAFYELREDFPAQVSDQEIVRELSGAFDGEAAGSTELAAAIAERTLHEAMAADELAAYELIDDEGNVYRWDPQEWHDDITADGWLGERWEEDYE
ncbi:MAG: DUF6323 family protein [Coriobacteriales bacterium]